LWRLELGEADGDTRRCHWMLIRKAGLGRVAGSEVLNQLVVGVEVVGADPIEVIGWVTDPSNEELDFPSTNPRIVYGVDDV